ncbi:YfbM family protein [Yinghuangia seranimata]|nr:YfbM family protein [Yinghuangia seranimata]MDI2127121.1 YfbM family protein [Yinghuangia seranimata]
MACRAVIFALDTKDAERLLAAEDDGEVMALIEEIEEESWTGDHYVALDKSWDALHRCLTDGDLAFGNGDYPLSHAILGGRLLHDEDDYIVSYVDPDQVREIAAALATLDEPWLRERFSTLTFDDYQGTGDEDDITYTLAFLPDLKDFYRTAAANGRAAIFTVDQ